ncbi:MAG TPA: metallopeptidase TldD-related protein [Bryobacteraceae bacterium]|nr:metallopeptidase TldD-related protein [Bryobacteraceae bacterium]
MLSREQAKKVAGRVLSYSSFPDCDVSLTSSERAFIRFARNGITTSGYTIGQTLTITSVKEGRTGSTTVDEFDDRSLKEAVRRTEQLALISPPDPERSESLAPQKYAAIENFADSTATARNDVMIPHLRAIIERAESSGLVAAGFMERTAASSALANRRGNFGYGRLTDSHLSATVRNAEGTSSGWASQPAVRIEEINGAAVAKTAIDKCLGWKNPRRLDPGKYTVVLEPTAVGDLVERIAFSFQARSAEEGRSWLSRKGGGTLAGEKLFPDSITLRTDPFHKLYSSLPWNDGAGLPSGPVAWIEKGVVKNLFYDRYWARKAGRQPTPFPGNLVLDGGGKTLADLIGSVERGLLVTRFWYIRPVNPQTGQQTGLTRDGLFLIENGKVTSPVVNFRFNESPVRLLQNAVAIGTPTRVRGGEGAGMIAPPMVVKDFPFTSVSDAV